MTEKQKARKIAVRKNGHVIVKASSSNIQKQRKVARRRRFCFKYGIFQIQESAFILRESTPLGK